MHPDSNTYTQQSEVCKMEGKLGRVCGWCGKAPKSIFQLSYHLELFSRAMALTHTHTYRNASESSA